MTRRRRRILRGAMWGCVAISVLGATAWAVSRWYDFGYKYRPAGGYGLVEANGGCLGVAVASLPAGPMVVTGHFAIFERKPTPGWSSQWGLEWEQDYRGILVPLWFLTLLPVALAAFCFYLTRRPMPGLCPRCGYDLAGSPSGVCPECGEAGESKGGG